MKSTSTIHATVGSEKRSVLKKVLGPIIITLLLTTSLGLVVLANASPQSKFNTAYTNTKNKLSESEFKVPDAYDALVGSGSIGNVSVDLGSGAGFASADSLSSLLISGNYEYSKLDKQAYLQGILTFGAQEQPLLEAFLSDDALAVSVPVLTDLIVKIQDNQESSEPHQIDLSEIQAAKDAILENATFTDSQSNVVVMTLYAEDVNNTLSKISELALKYLDDPEFQTQAELSDEDYSQIKALFSDIKINEDILVSATIENALFRSVEVSTFTLDISSQEVIVFSGLKVSFDLTGSKSIKLTGSIGSDEPYYFEITAIDQSTLSVLNITASGKVTHNDDSFTASSTAYFDIGKSKKNLRIQATFDVNYEGETIEEDLLITSDIEVGQQAFSAKNGLIQSTTLYGDATYLISAQFELNAASVDSLPTHDFSSAVPYEDVTEEQWAEIKEALTQVEDLLSTTIEGLSQSFEFPIELETADAEVIESYLSNPELAELFQGYGIDLSEYATFADGVWTPNFAAIQEFLQK